MRVQKAAYLLIFLTLWAQFDGVLLTVFPILPSASLASDDDEYSVVKREQRAERESNLQKALPEGLRPNTAGCFAMSPEKGAPPESKFSGSVGQSLLFVFMSLQL
jgi:hypothetical protein